VEAEAELAEIERSVDEEGAHKSTLETLKKVDKNAIILSKF